MATAVLSRREKVSKSFATNKSIILLTCLLVPLLAFISPVLSIIFVYGFGFYLLFKSDYKFLIFFVCFIFIQNITLMMFAERFTSTTNTLFSLGKEIMVYVFCLKNILFAKNRRRIYPQILISILMLGFIVVSFFMSDAEMYAKIVSVRQLFLPFVCFYFGYYLNISETKKKRLFDLIVVLAIITAIVGLIEILILKDSFWVTLPIKRYQENKGTEFDMYKGVPLNFYTWDFKDMTGNIIRRLVSIFGDPLTTAHFLFLGFVLTSFSNAKRKKLIKTILFVASILTFSKGVYVCYLLYFLLKLLKKMTFKQFKILFFVLVILAVVFFSTFTTLISRLAPTSSIIIHINGFINGVFNSSLLGSGVGKAGVIVSIKTGIDRLTGESYIGVISSQLGIIGLIIYVLFVVSVIFALYRSYSKSKNQLTFLAMVLLLGVFAESFFSESSVGLVATGLYFMLVGHEFRNSKKGQLSGRKKQNC